ncbi:DNA repair protein REV1 [Frankliniella fusca]|uniref:DNA repair protein REV1 n=1 Tax=Frankliniella fusca TaxID=407009 RepID=A0AAE1L8H6_9NEOP|nr:DNA repair protein REV1 [Frankliniella fusca]
MAPKLILLFVVLALASIGVLAGPQNKQHLTLERPSCNGFKTSALNFQIQSCARYLHPQQYSRPGSFYADYVQDYIEKHKDCSSDTIINVLTDSLDTYNYYYDAENQKVVDCVKLSLSSGVCCMWS